MLEHHKINIVKSLPSEADIRIGVLIPLFRKMKYIRILDNQSSDECGVDVILEGINELGRLIYTSIIIKKGDLNARAGGSNAILRTITDQVEQAWTHPLTHPEVPERSYSSRIWIVTNGKVSRNARSYLESTCKKQNSENRNLDILDQRNLIELLDRYWPEYYDDQRPFLSQYHKKLCTVVAGLDLKSLGYDKEKKLEDIYI